MSIVSTRYTSLEYGARRKFEWTGSSYLIAQGSKKQTALSDNSGATPNKEMHPTAAAQPRQADV